MRFASVAGVKYILQIYDATASAATPTELTAAASPFATNEDADDDLYMPVRAQSGYIRFLITAGQAAANIVADINPPTSTSRPVVLCLRNADGTAGTVEWMGFLTGEQYSRPWDPAPYEVEIPVTSVMGCMAAVDFTQSEGYTSLRSACEAVASYVPGGSMPIVFPSSIDADAKVVNYNFQEYMSIDQREEEATDDIYNSISYKEVVEYFCKYFGVSCRQHGASLYFYAHDAESYTGAEPSVVELDVGAVRSKDNSAGFSPAYHVETGTFDVGTDKLDKDFVSMPESFYKEFGIRHAYRSYVLYGDSDHYQSYANGQRGFITILGTTRQSSPSESSFGQNVSYANVNYSGSSGTTTSSRSDSGRSWNGSTQGRDYTTDWSNGFLFRIKQGMGECTLMKIVSKRNVYVAPFDGALFNIDFMVENDMPTNERGDGQDSDPFIRCVYAKVRLGKHYLSSVVHTQQSGDKNSTFYCDYSWTEAETVCCIALIDNKVQFYQGNAASSFAMGGRRVATETHATQVSAVNLYPLLSGINIDYPDGVKGSFVDFSIEILGKVYDDRQFFFKLGDFYNASDTTDGKCYNYIQFLIKDFAARTVFPTDMPSQLQGDADDTNRFSIVLGNPFPDKYEVSSTITTRRNLQHGTGILLTADGACVTEEYDLEGMRRRAKVISRIREEIEVTMDGGLLLPIDVVAWGGKTFAVVSQSMDWKHDKNKMTLLNIDRA